MQKQTVVLMKIPNLATLNMRKEKLGDVQKIINETSIKLKDAKADNEDYKHYLKSKINFYKNLEFRIQRLIKVDEKIVKDFYKKNNLKKVGQKNGNKRT